MFLACGRTSGGKILWSGLGIKHMLAVSNVTVQVGVSLTACELRVLPITLGFNTHHLPGCGLWPHLLSASVAKTGVPLSSGGQWSASLTMSKYCEFLPSRSISFQREES